MCTFPAKELLRWRRQMVWRAEMSNDLAFREAAGRFVMGVDALRIAHEEADNCLCWYEAIKAAAEVCIQTSKNAGLLRRRKGPAIAPATPEVPATGTR
jgi:hypothetical protein